MRIWKVAGVSVLVLGLVLGLALPALAAPPDWAPPKADHVLPKLLRGEVIQVDEGKTFFIIIQSHGQEVTISVDSDTQYFKVSVPRGVPALVKHQLGLVEQVQENSGLRQQIKARLELRLENQEGFGLGRWLRPFGEEASFDNIAVGSGVVVRTVAGEDNPLAKLVFIVELTGCGHILGTIKDISSGDKTITVAPADGGDDVVLSYGDRTHFILRGAPGLEGGELVRVVYDEEKMAKLVSMVVEDLD